MYVYVDGKAPYQRDDLDWLLEQVQGQSAARRRRFPEQARVLEFLDQSRQQLLRIREPGGQPAPEKKALP